MIGEKIKTLRAKTGMTQKDLADKLFVTSQAVSRWENGEVEPSISTVSEMAKIFNVTIDELVNENSSVAETQKEEPVKVETVVEEKIVYKEAPKVHLCLCENCNDPIYEKNDIHRFTTTKVHRSGRSTHRETIDHIYCTKCYDAKLRREKQEAEAKAIAKRERMRKKRVNSFIWPTIAAAIVIIICVCTQKYIGCIAGGLLFTFLADLILGNNFIGDLWYEISSWSIKLPGVIFTLDLDGILWLISVKLFGAILGFFVSILAVIFATALGMALSVIVYPIALVRNCKGKDEAIIDL